MNRRLFLSLSALAFCLALPSCALADDTPTYRYRLKVEVQTPDGLKTGSSVIEVDTGFGITPMDMSEVIRWKVRGEAVAVDLPSGHVLFAVLRSESDVDWAKRVMLSLAPDGLGTGKERFISQHQAMIEDREEKTLPRTFPAYKWIEERSAYPMLVTFDDLDDPTSVKEVDPDDLAATFGEGYALNRITVQITDEDVTTGIEERLGWLPDYYNKQFSGDRFQMLKNQDKGLSAFISAGAFSAGIGLRNKGKNQ